MCTVSFVPLHDSVIITSNRDENIQRENAAAPSFQLINNKRIIFPKDAKAGGTWFAVSETGAVAVLLNGAFVKHVPESPYRKSRGLILLDIIAADKPFEFFREMELYRIEPFTLILSQPGQAHELRWDGNKKHICALSMQGNYIWSSSTLYTPPIIEEREKLFHQFVTNESNKTPGLVHDLHNSDNGDMENGFIINRDTGMKTFSITQAVIRKSSIDFLHDDLLHRKQYRETIVMTQTHNKTTREEI